jgi:pyruvate dehydrogenase E2 component (dihydrolipoamide acetyltransferase)
MAEIVRMPRMTDSMEEGNVVGWSKKVGDRIEAGDLLAEIETDKATMEFESPYDGTLLYIGVEKGPVKIGEVLAVLGEPGEDYKAILSGGSAKTPEVASKAQANGHEVKQDAPKAAPAVAYTGTAQVVTMPRMTDSMEEGIVVGWSKKVGDRIEAGDLLAEIETDKATMEFESPYDGTLLYIGVEKGPVKIGEVLAVLGEPGDDYKAAIAAHQGKSAAPALQQQAAPLEKTVEMVAAASVSNEGERVKASPLARSMAKQSGVDIVLVKGTGDHGRVVRRDIEAFLAKKQAAPAAPKPLPASAEQKVVAKPSPQVAEAEGSYTDVPVTQMRKTIARRLGESKFSAPHFYLTIEVNMDKAVETRKYLNDIAPVKISFNDFVIKSAAAALRLHPEINASWLGDRIRQNHEVHIGVAVAVPEGLLVPVVRNADGKGLAQINAEVKAFAEKAKSKKLALEEMQGNTFTISNLGMFGIEEFTAIINPPDACILAVGAIIEKPIVKNSEIVVGNMMKMTLSCDHRVVDGAMGAAFLQTLKNILEEPMRLLV